MNILVEYQLVGCSRRHRLKISPQDYFDPIEEGQNYWDHGIEKKIFLHEYLKVDPDQIKWIVAHESKGSQKRIRRAQYLDGDNVTMEHIVDENKEEQINLGARLPDSEEWHVIRMVKRPGKAWSVIFNEIGSDIPIDGEFESTDLCKQWTYEELEEFGEIGNNESDMRGGPAPYRTSDN
jgi:hypothetical protein